MAEDDASLKIALYSGIFVQHDAVSDSLSCKLRILEGLRRSGAGIEMTVFTRHSEHHAPYVRPMGSVERLLHQQEFWEADVHMFEFAMRYDLFDSVFVIPPDRPVVVTEHNTTPPELVDDPIMKQECALSLIQRHNMALAYRVVCDSEFNLELARSISLPEERLSVMHLPPAHAPEEPLMEPNGRDQPVRMLYVGRFVRAKGVPDLLTAVEALWSSGDVRFDLTLVGNPAFSEETVTGQVRRFVERFGEDGRARVVLDASDDELASIFARSDALVIPSYHEGYCVPAVEALAARCFVIGYDAGNLPNVFGGLGTIVPTGDEGALAEAISVLVDRVWAARDGGSIEVLPADRGDMDRRTWDESVRLHLRDYSEDNYERKFLGLLLEVADASSAAASQRFRAAVLRRLGELTAGDALSPAVH